MMLMCIDPSMILTNCSWPRSGVGKAYDPHEARAWRSSDFFVSHEMSQEKEKRIVVQPIFPITYQQYLAYIEVMFL